MTTPATWHDAEKSALLWMAREFPEQLPAGNFGTSTPLDLQDRIAGGLTAYARVEKIDGRDDGITDVSVLDVEISASTRRLAYTLSEDIRARLLRSPHRVNNVILDRVITERAPTRLPAEDPNINRFTATYRISARR